MTVEALAAPGGEPIAGLIAAGRHRDALALIAREHAAAVGRLAMALLGSQAEAEELTQEVLLAAYRAFSGYRAEGSVRAWLLGITRRQCAKRLSKRARREQRLRLVDEPPAAAGPDELLARRQRAETIRRALETLRPADREAVVLRYESGLSYAEISALLGLDPAAARKRTSRALGHLRTHLSKEGAL